MTDRPQDFLPLAANFFAKRFLIVAGALLALTVGTAPQSQAQIVGGAIPVGVRPQSMVFNPLTNRIYVANAGPLASGSQTTLTVIDGSTGNSSTVTVGGIPEIVAVNPVTDKVYVAFIGGGISVLDGSTNTIIKTHAVNATALAVNPVTNKIYAGGLGLTVIDGTTDTIEQTIQAGGSHESVAVNPATNTIYTADSNLTTVTVIDGASGQITATVTLSMDLGNGPMPVSPSLLAVNSVTNKVYIGLGPGRLTEQGQPVMVLDGATNNVTQVAVPVLNASTDNAFSLAINPVTNKIYVGYAGGTPSNTVIGEIDGVTNTETLIPTGLEPTAVAVNLATNQIYAANLGDGTITIIDGATHASRTISVGANPIALAVNPITNIVSVLNQSVFGSNGNLVPGSVQFISRLTGNATISAGSDPFAVAVDPVLNKTYLANDCSNDVTVIDGSTNAATTIPAGTNPFAVAVDPITGQAFVTNQGSNTVTAIDGSTNAATTIPAGMAPEAVAINSVTGTAYVANSGSGSVTVINEATGITATVATGSTPVALAVNPATNRIYVADEGGNDVTIISGATNTTSSIPVGSSPDAVAVNPATNKIYVADRGDNDVTVIDGATGTTSRVTVGTSPIALAVNPVTNKIYVANEGSNDVTVIDGGSNSPSSVAVGVLPYALAINLASNRIYVANNGSNDVTVIDGADNSVSTLPGGSSPVSLAVNPITSKIYVADLGDEATILTEQVTQPTPLVTQIAPFTGNITTGPAPTFTFTTSSSYTPTEPPVLDAFYQVDTLTGPWLAASGSAPTFTGQTQPLTFGTHILYAYALDAQAALVNGQMSGVPSAGQYITGSLTAYLFVVAPLGTQITLTSDKNPSQVGDTVNLTATVAPAPTATGTPTGTVDFFDGTAFLGSATLDSNGNSTFATSALAAGTHQITAKYEGDSIFAGGASAPLAQTVNENFTVSANPNALTITHGLSGTSTLTITPAGGADSVPISFSCAGLPAGSTCTFSPATVTPGSKLATTTLTIQTAGSALSAPPLDGPSLPPGLMVLLALAAALGIATTLLHRRGPRWSWASATCLLAVLGFTALMTACGGGSAPVANPAPTGNFTVTVHATAGSVDKTIDIMLTVN